MYLRDLSYEIAGDDVYDFFRGYSEVLTVERTVSSDFSLRWEPDSPEGEPALFSDCLWVRVQNLIS